MSNPNPPAAVAPPPRRWMPWIGWGALIAYAALIAVHFANVAGGADSSGYLNSARLLASGRLVAELRAPAEFGPAETLNRQQFQPHGFAPFDGVPGLSPTYAVGLPLHLALAGKLFGWTAAPIVVGVAGAVGALLLCFALARQWQIDFRLAALGATLLAVYPVFVFTSIQPLSDTLATAWCLAAVYTAVRAGPGWALACGGALSVAVLVRATNLLLLPALLILLGTHPRRLAFFVLGGVPGTLWLGFYNHAIYGSPFRSGYVDLSLAFGWAYGWPALVHFAQWLALLLPAPLLILPAFAWRAEPRRRREFVALTVWFAAFVGLYAFYKISQEAWWDLRFILPGTPALILAALLGIERLALARSGTIADRFRTFAGVVLAGWALGLGVFWSERFHLRLIKTYEQSYVDAAMAARASFPADALIVAGHQSGALYYYTTFPLLRWEFVQPPNFARFRALTEKSGRPICAVLHKLETDEALNKHCPGDWTQIGEERDVTLWRLAFPRISAQ